MPGGSFLEAGLGPVPCLRRHRDHVHMRVVPPRLLEPQEALKADRVLALPYRVQISGWILNRVAKICLICRMAQEGMHGFSMVNGCNSPCLVQQQQQQGDRLLPLLQARAEASGVARWFIVRGQWRVVPAQDTSACLSICSRWYLKC